MNRFVSVLAWVGTVFASIGASASSAGAQTVDICHRARGAKGNTREAELIKVSPNEVPKFIAGGDYRAFNGKCFALMPDDKGGASSESVCQTVFGGHLASIHSKAEDDFLSSVVGPDHQARIGGTAASGFCAGPDAKYAWLDGTAWDYQNWRLGTGEPNCSGPKGSSIQFWPSTNGKLSGWNDVPLEDSLGKFVCEFLPVPPVEICHRLGGATGNTSEVELIKVSSNEVPKFIAGGDYRAFNGKCFALMPDDKGGASSESVCQTVFGGHLASIHSKAEDDFLSSVVGPDHQARIGGTAASGFCAGPDAKYAWLDGTAWDYQNWRLGTGEPNCSGPKGSSIQFWPSTNGKLSGWNDVPLEDSLGKFVCEFPPRRPGK